MHAKWRRAFAVLTVRTVRSSPCCVLNGIGSLLPICAEVRSYESNNLWKHQEQAFGLFAWERLPRQVRRYLATSTEAGIIHRWSFNTDAMAEDSVGTAHGTLVNGAMVTGGQLVLTNAAMAPYVSLPPRSSRSIPTRTDGGS